MYFRSFFDGCCNTDQNTPIYSQTNDDYRYFEYSDVYRIDNVIVEYAFFRQNDLFYCFGSKALLYDVMVNSGSYTTEETIRKDVVNTMWRGVGLKNVGAPAWGVSTDEQIFSMTVNAKKPDDIISVNEKDGKKYYFWIMTDVGEIKTIDDVKAAKIEIYE